MLQTQVERRAAGEWFHWISRFSVGRILKQTFTTLHTGGNRTGSKSNLFQGCPLNAAHHSIKRPGNEVIKRHNPNYSLLSRIDLYSQGRSVRNQETPFYICFKQGSTSTGAFRGKPTATTTVQTRTQAKISAGRQTSHKLQSLMRTDLLHQTSHNFKQIVPQAGLFVPKNISYLKDVLWHKDLVK